MLISKTGLSARETGVVAEGELHACFLEVADLAAIVEACGEGLFFVGEVVPGESCGLDGDFGVEVFAEEVPVQKDAFVFLK